MTPTDPEAQTTVPEAPAAPVAIEPLPASAPAAEPDPWETRALVWVFWGANGLRAGWSVVAFLIVFGFISAIAGTVFLHFHLIAAKGGFTPSQTFFGELISVLGMVGGMAVVALVERRRRNLLAFNLIDARAGLHFFGGLVAGCAALSALIGALSLGGWLHFGPVALSGGAILKYAALWGAAFLLVGCFEEGTFRCYLQFTLTRGLNLWWALGIVALICGELLWLGKGNGIRGVYLMAALGVIPCLMLHLRRAESTGFWCAAWVTSTLFGFIHTGNNGENWIGIFAAAAIGFVFVVSLRVTGSAWWAIGCHAAWDWSETYLYGAADSGNVATGHYLSTRPAGPELWSGGTDGPEGSVLVLAVILLMLAALVAYGRMRRTAVPGAVVEAAEG